MLKYTELEPIFLQNEIVIHEYNVEVNDDIELPYVVYTINGNESYSADGITYFNTFEISMAMFDETLNFPLQRRIENVLEENTAFFDKQVNFDSESRIYTISYQFTVIDDAYNQY